MAAESFEPEQLPRIVRRLLSQDEALAASLRKVDLGEEQLDGLAQAYAEEIFKSATPERERLDVAEAQFGEAEARVPQVRHYDIPLAHRPLRATFIVGLLLSSALFAIAIFLPSSGIVTIAWLVAAVVAAAGASIAVGLQLVVRTFEQHSVELVIRLERKLGIDALRLNRDRARDEYAQALLERGLLPRVLAEREARTEPVFTTTLSFVTARGLSEVYDPALYEVETPAVRRLRTLLDQTPGGSIGLSGPRGTGKSTIMASFVEGRSRRSDGKRGHSALVTAPVDYLPRDFILHLFAKLCETVVVPDPLWGRPRAQDFGFEEDLLVLRRSMAVQRLLVAFGPCLVAGAGMALIIWRTAFPKFNPDWRLIGGLVLLLASSSLFFWARQRHKGRMRENIDRAQAHHRMNGPERQARRGVSEELAKAASDYLDVIGFQQTYTEGWSGSLKLSLGAVEGTGGLTGGGSYARNALSLPEIASHFKGFVRGLVKDGPLIIGIDELDKIESGERARAFLNDLKSVFGVAQCYFLVSVSEDALGSFQRRGLPVRDAFDSALDDVIRVSPLDFPTARTLIRNRVVGLPDPYVGLAFCLSGGLPREIIRSARSIVAAGENGKTRLSTVCRSLLREDLDEKRVVSMSVVACHGDFISSDILARLRSLSIEPEAGKLLREARKHLPATEYDGSPHPVSGVGPGAPSGLAPNEQNKEPEPADRARQVFAELIGYFYFAAAMLQTFTDDLDEAQFQRFTSESGDGTLSQLARARQAFALDSALAMAEVTGFCTSNQLGSLSEAAAPSVTEVS